jgi:hypothetical protein
MATRRKPEINKTYHCGTVTAFGPAPLGSSRKGIRVQFVCALCGLIHEADWSNFKEGYKSQECVRTKKCIEHQNRTISAMTTQTLKSILNTVEMKGREAAAQRHGISLLDADFASRKHLTNLIASIPTQVRQKLHSLAHSGVSFAVLAAGKLGQSFDLGAGEIKAIVRKFQQKLKAAEDAKTAEAAEEQAANELTTIFQNAVSDMQCAVLEAAEDADGVLSEDAFSFLENGTTGGRYGACNDQVGLLAGAGAEHRDVAFEFVAIVERTRDHRRNPRKARTQTAHPGLAPATSSTFP